MALDPRISLGVQPLQIESPINMMGQIAQLRAGQQQEQFNAMRLAQAQRQQQEEDRFNALMARGGATPRELIGSSQGREALKSISEFGLRERQMQGATRQAEKAQFEMTQTQTGVVRQAMRSLSALPDEMLTRQNIAPRLMALAQQGIPQSLIEQTIAQISDNPVENRREIESSLRADMSAKEQSSLTAPKLEPVTSGDGRTIMVDMNPNSPTFSQPKLITPAAPFNLSPGQMRVEGGRVVAQAPFAPRPEAMRPEPAPAITEIIDPDDPTRLIKIDARTGRTLGVSGKSPEAAKAAAKQEEKAQKMETANAQLVGVLDDLRANYQQLDKLRAIPSTERGMVSNLTAAAAASGPGQVASRALGTEAQVHREAIMSSRNMLLNAIKTATGMSAQQLNSNVEFQSWLRALTDPGQPIQAVDKIITQLEDFIAKAQQSPGKMPAREEAPAARGRAGRDDYPAPKSEAEFSALPSGSMFLDPTGQLRRKP